MKHSSTLVLLLSVFLIRTIMADAHECHGAMIAWLREQAASSEDPEARRSARYLMRAHGIEAKEVSPYTPKARHRQQSPAAVSMLNSLRVGRGRHETHSLARKQAHLDLQSQALGCLGSCNDGPALRAALRPMIGTQEAWLLKVGWPLDPNANPCDGDGWDGCICVKGRIVELETYDDWPGYSLQSALANVTRLRRLDFSSTSLSGTVPDGLTWGLARLEFMYFHETSLSGTLPESIGKLAQLRDITLTSTRVSGTLPNALAAVQSLRNVLVGRNMLSGTIPNFAALNALEILIASHNSVSGTLSNNTMKLMQLRQLDLTETSMSGTISENIGDLARLEFLYLETTAISGTLPRRLGDLAQLKAMPLTSTLLSGTLPNGLLELRNVKQVSLDNTSVSGTLPEGIGKLTQLTTIYFNAMPLSGTLPKQIGDLINLDVLDLSYTLISGSLPRSTCATHVDIHGSALQSVPTIAKCLKLRTLDLSNNSLRTLPSSLPSSVTHFYVNANPISINTNSLAQVLNSTDLVALDVQFVNVPMIFKENDPRCLADVCHGPRVAAPGTCSLNTDSVCQWKVTLYDAWDQPCHVGGMVQNLSLGLGCENGFASCQRRAPMEDTRDGSFAATVGTDWITSKGRYIFQFFYKGDEFRPTVFGNSVFAYDTLRTVQFQARTDCPVHSHVDANGIDCNCDKYFERSKVNGSTACERKCEGGRTPSTNGSCICPSHTYDSSIAGVLRCAASEWSPYDTGTSADCIPCPECMRCENGGIELRQGWRFATGNMDVAFRCPYAEINDTKKTCPAMSLPVSEQPPCLGNHMGELCAVCQAHYTRHVSSDNRCEPCSHVSYSVLGISSVWFLIVILVLVVGLGALLWCARQQIAALKALVWTHARILLGWAQVLSLLSRVLDIVYPAHARTALSVASLAVADVRGIVRFDCLGWTWYGKWFTMIFGVLGVFLLLIGLRFLYRYCTHQDSARAEAIATFFFVAMLLYPQLSATILSALKCRRLGPTTSVLDMDYSIYCSDHSFLPTIVLAWILVVLVPLGFPLALLALLWQLWSSQDPHESSIGHVRAMYGFCVDDYRPGCWFYEPLDMIRKLALTGLLQFVHRGTATQVFFGCALAFVSSGVQLRLLPYREPEANVLKTLVDGQLFLTFLLSFLLRVLPWLQITTYEPLSVDFYGWLLLLSVAALLVVAVLLTIRKARRIGFKMIESHELEVFDTAGDVAAGFTTAALGNAGQE